MRDDPIVIGGLEGSGAQLVAGLAQAGGVFMGADLDEALDSEPILRFYDKWLYPYVAQDGQFNPVDAAQIGEDFGHS